MYLLTLHAYSCYYHYRQTIWKNAKEMQTYQRIKHIYDFYVSNTNNSEYKNGISHTD
jgi:hypothetical protein